MKMKTIMKNNKREIKKVLNKAIENCPDYEKIEVFTWVNNCWCEELGAHESYRVMVHLHGVKDENSEYGAYKNSELLTWKETLVLDSEDTDEHNKAMYQSFRATKELTEWCKTNFDRVMDVEDWIFYF